MTVPTNYGTEYSGDIYNTGAVFIKILNLSNIPLLNLLSNYLTK